MGSLFESGNSKVPHRLGENSPPRQRKSKIVIELSEPFSGWAGGARLKTSGAHAHYGDRPEEELALVDVGPKLVRALPQYSLLLPAVYGVGHRKRFQMPN